MLESILVKNNVKSGIKITVKSAVAAFIIAVAVALPQLFHLVAGANSGIKWLPMYFPVLIGGCVLGVYWGMGIGVFAPLFSFLITAAIGNPMPALSRLPFMMAELAVFAAVSGMFSDKIMQNKWLAFPAVLLAEVGGRGVFLALVAIFEKVSPLSLSVVWAQVQSGFIALICQAVLVPVIVTGIAYIIEKSGNKTEQQK